MATPATTVASLTTLMLSWLDDPTAGYFTASTTLQWLNFAQREVQKKLILAGKNYYEVPVETLTVYGQSAYKLPSDFLKEHRLELVISGTGNNENRKPLYPIILNEQDKVSIAVGEPTNYYLASDRFIITPPPQTANQILRLYYSPLLSDLTSTSQVPNIPEEYMEYVAIIAAENGFIKDDRMPTNLLVKKKAYDELFENMKNERTQDQSRQVLLTDDYEGGGFI